MFAARAVRVARQAGSRCMSGVTSRIRNAEFAKKVVTADEAAAMIPNHAIIGMSGFTGSGYPKAVPTALANRIKGINTGEKKFKVGIYTGASTAPELDGALAAVDGIEMRLPFQSDPICRQKINAGTIEYQDLHLSHVAPHVWQGFMGKMSWALIEATAITEDGLLIPSTSIGNNKTWLDVADNVIIEVNERWSTDLEGMHDVYYGTALPPHRKPIMLTKPDDRIGDKYLRVDPKKVVAVVNTNKADRNNAFTPPDDASQRIAGHILDFFAYEIKHGRMPKNLLPLQSGVGNVANAVMHGLKDSPYEGLTAFTEVIQDGMLDLLNSGKMATASCTAFSLSTAGLGSLESHLKDDLNKRIIMRTQEISNHPELVRRLGLIAMNSLIEADIYGNVNSTHVMGTSMMNGIGGSGDFARNAYCSIFMTSSTAKNGQISCIVPFVSHVDHTEHDTQIFVTEQGLADLRGLSPKQRANVIIERCAHPDFRPALRDYFNRSLAGSFGRHTPHLLDEALGWHSHYLKTGSMPKETAAELAARVSAGPFPRAS